MREMKDSGVEWIGEIPESWGIRRIKNIASLAGRIGWQGLTSDEYSGDGAYLITGVDFKNGRINWASCVHVPFSRWEEAVQIQIKEGDLLITKDGTVGKVAIAENVPGKTSLNSGVLLIRNYDVCNTRFLFWMIQSEVFWKWFGIINSGNSTIIHLYQHSFENFSFPFPKEAIQKRIADYLDSKCSKIDEIIAKQEQIIEKLKEYKLSVITEAVTKGLNPDVEMKDSGVEWLGSVPKSWNLYRIASLYYQTSEQGKDELPILTVSINSGISDRELDDVEQDRVFVRSEDRTKYKRVQSGDLVYNMMRAWQGAFGAVRVEGMVSPAYITCRPKAGIKIDTRYIEYLFRTRIATEEMHRYSHGIADFRLRLYWSEFKNIRLCLPSIDEQREIADYIDKKVMAIDISVCDREKALEKLRDYKKSLIYEVVTGKKEV